MTTAPRSRFHPFHSQPAAWQHHILDSAALRRLSGQALHNAQVSRHINGHNNTSQPANTAPPALPAVLSPRNRAVMSLPVTSSPSLLATAAMAAVDPVGASKKDDESSHHFSTPLLSISADNHSTDNAPHITQSSHHLRSRFSSPASFASVFGSSHSSTTMTQLHHASLLPAPHAHDQFVNLLQDEMARVNTFVEHRTTELRQQFNSIETQASRIVGKKDVSPLSSPAQSGGSEVSDLDGTDDDPTLDPIKAGYVDLYGQVMLLQSFAVQHASLFTSIVRQYSLFSSGEKLKYMEKLDGVEMKHNREIMELLEHIEVVYGELCIADFSSTAGNTTLSELNSHQPTSPDVTDSLLHSKLVDLAAAGSVSSFSSSAASPSASLALLRSQARALLFTHQQQPTSWSTFDRGLRFGITLLLFFWVLWDCVVDARIRPQYPVEWVQSVLPVYRGIGVLLLLEWGWGCNLYIWDKYRINYMQLLELDTRSTMTYAEVFDEATTASMMFLANFLIYFKILRGDFPPWIPAGYFPILLFIYMLYKLLPWSGHGRSVIWYGLAQVVLSPFGRVIFLTTYTGDILTSLVKPIIDWSYTLCFLVTLEWVNDSVNDEVCLQSRLFNYVIVPLLSALPLWFRFMQCLRRYMDTRKRWPHLANAGKYALSHSVVLFGVFHHTFTDSKSIDSYRVYWIISLVISTLYSYLWDIFIDFGLGDMRYGGLRDQLMYSSKTVYYVCIVADLFLRFAWSLTLVPRGEHAPFAPSVIIYLQPLLAVAEVTRRCMWGALRLEYEHINVLGFKKAEGVSAVNVTAGGAGGAGGTGGTSDGRTGCGVILEVAVITLMVLSVGLVAAMTAN